mmetsp:Transcript_4906/g.17028  ORF Transcript_4906/g.17028 Transcript_4906/m.17028 type:complete len:216 (-) Transcript_4906:100-747(-)
MHTTSASQTTTAQTSFERESAKARLRNLGDLGIERRHSRGVSRLRCRKVLLHELQVERLELREDVRVGRGLEALSRREVVHVIAEGAHLAAEFGARLDPVLLLVQIGQVVLDAHHRLLHTRRRLVRRELLEREAGGTVQSRLLREVEVAGLVDELETILVDLLVILKLDLRAGGNDRRRLLREERTRHTRDEGERLAAALHRLRGSNHSRRAGRL